MKIQYQRVGNSYIVRIEDAASTDYIIIVRGVFLNYAVPVVRTIDPEIRGNTYNWLVTLAEYDLCSLTMVTLPVQEWENISYSIVFQANFGKLKPYKEHKWPIEYVPERIEKAHIVSPRGSKPLTQ